MTPISLARIPTPVHALPRLSEKWGVDLYVKRDDLTGFILSGNKVRKLEYLLADAIQKGADSVISCGGLQSNHCRAVAYSCRQMGMRPILLLRGDRETIPSSNALLDELAGADIVYCTKDEYESGRNSIMEQMAGQWRGKGYHPYVIPEGGSNSLGALGYTKAGGELQAQVPEGFDQVVVAVGSGGTLAGLALGPKIGPLKGVAVCQTADYFRKEIEVLARHSETNGWGTLQPWGPQGWSVVDGYQGPGYGMATPEVWQTIRLVAELEGLVLDPVYTGKAMHALQKEIEAGVWSGRILFWHTGGGFGVFGRGEELINRERSRPSS